MVDATELQHWSQLLQRRVIRLLLQHDTALFRNQFHLFFVNSKLPEMELLQQYDRYIKFRILSNQLLDDILPRIRRQLSLKTDQKRLHEESPTRGEIDWTRTIERGWEQTPGLPPQQFETRLRQRSMETPENVLAVAMLLAFRQGLQQARTETFSDEELQQREKEAFSSVNEQVERELATTYARALIKQASLIELASLVQQVSQQLRPGPSPYRDLIAWWQRFSQFRIGRQADERNHSLSSRRSDEKTDAWLYELWIMLEYVHLLHEQAESVAQDITLATDHLQCRFSWQGRKFRLIYNRQLDTSTGYEAAWEHAPASRPDYTIERAEPLEIRHEQQLIWREPPVVLDAKYYLNETEAANTHGPIKKLLGDMTLLEAQNAVLFFPQLTDPGKEQAITRTIRRASQQYNARRGAPEIHLYQLNPAMPFAQIQQRLRATLDLAVQHLPERAAPTCRGVWLDVDNINVSQHKHSSSTLLCPKPHIGPGVADLVDVNTDCLKNPLLCHVIGQAIVPPFVLRATTQHQLVQQSQTLRDHNHEYLSQAEQAGQEEQAEEIRQQIFTGVGQATERYVSLFCNTKSIEEHLEKWAFHLRWKGHPRSLAESTRNALISGEYVWDNYQSVELKDWAAPAIQYCRALEFELKRRLYNASAARYPANRAGFTIGTVDYAYKEQHSKKEAQTIWSIFVERVEQSGANLIEFTQLIQRIHEENVKDNRNNLAHGGAITSETAGLLKDIVIGERSRPGILCWLAEHLDPLD